MQLPGMHPSLYLACGEHKEMKSGHKQQNEMSGPIEWWKFCACHYLDKGHKAAIDSTLRDGGERGREEGKGDSERGWA